MIKRFTKWYNSLNELNQFYFLVIITMVNMIIVPIIISLIFNSKAGFKYFLSLGLGIPYLYYTAKELEYYSAIPKAESENRYAWKEYESFKPVPETAKHYLKKAKKSDSDLEATKNKKEMYDRMVRILRGATLLFGMFYFFQHELIGSEKSNAKIDSNKIEINKLEQSITQITNEIKSLPKDQNEITEEEIRIIISDYLKSNSGIKSGPKNSEY